MPDNPIIEQDGEEVEYKNVPVLVAEAIAKKMVEAGIVAEEPPVELTPWYDTQNERDVKISVTPSNITTDTRVARGVIKQIFATQVNFMKYLPEGDIEPANEVLDMAEKLTQTFAGARLTIRDVTVDVNAVLMFGATEILWNGDWQVDGLMKSTALIESDVFASSFVVVASRYLLIT